MRYMKRQIKGMRLYETKGKALTTEKDAENTTLAIKREQASEQNIVTKQNTSGAKVHQAQSEQKPIIETKQYRAKEHQAQQEQYKR